MTLRCVIIDDEPLAREILEDYAKRAPFLEVVATFDNGLAALTYLSSHPVDVLFLDIQMPELTGMQLLKVLPSPHPAVILTTAYDQYALEGYALQVTDYLLKPIAFDRFLQAAQRALQVSAKQDVAPPVSVVAPAASSEPDFLFVKTEHRMQRVLLDDLQYIEGMKDYLMLHTRVGKVMTLQNFKYFEDRLPAERFARVHKSYLVSIPHIEQIERNRITIGEQLIPISETYRERFMELLKQQGWV
ncbi:MAG TPA: DNA-binding response regulator [Cytophagales bacterium]|nr:DNA-binding response regulator [Cytophagales bacterium]